MNKNIKKAAHTLTKRFVIICAAIVQLGVVACDDMNSIHEEYYQRGEGIYTGVVDSLQAFSGFEKIRFDWEVSADPRITKTVIYWNQRSDSVVVDVNRSQSGRLQQSYELDALPEGTYTFEFITRDNSGHHSMPTELVAQVYGESYVQSLRNRGVASIAKQPDETMIVSWEPIASATVQYVTLKYMENGVERSIRVNNDEVTTVVSGLKTGDQLAVITTHLPENALETLDAIAREYTMPALERVINKANFNIVVLAGDNTSVAGDRNLARIWDGDFRNPNILHTVENAPGFNFPHHFTFDMGVLADLSRFRIWPRGESGPFTGHSPRYFEIWATDQIKHDANDESYWKSDNWKNDWTLLGDHEIVKPASAGDQAAEWTAGWEFPIREEVERVRYIRLVVKQSNWQGSNCVNIGEITLWGDDL